MPRVVTSQGWEFGCLQLLWHAGPAQVWRKGTSIWCANELVWFPFDLGDHSGSLTLSVAQSSAIGVSVAALPPCSGSVFARKFPPDSDRGVARWVRQGLFCEGWRGVAQHPRDISKIAGICCDTVCATLCSATGVTATVCH